MCRSRRKLVKTYVILRRDGWRSGDDLREAAERSTQVGDEEMSSDIRWIRSYVLAEESGGPGTGGLFQAAGPGKNPPNPPPARLPLREDVQVPDPALLPPDP